MKMIDILDKDRDHLLTELAASGSTEKAVIVLENEMDKLLLKHNEQCSSEREREAAAYMMQAVRLSLPLINTTGRTKVWEHGSDEEPARKFSPLAALLAIAGIALCVFGLLPLILTIVAGADTATRNEIFTRGGSIVSSLILMFFAGSLFGRPKAKNRKEHHVEIHVDADKVYRTFRTAILSVDQSLDEIQAKERWEKREQAGNIDGRKATTPELELFSDLIAASYSGDPEYALEIIDEVKYFLHRQQIEVVDYSEKTKQYFDLMPGVQAGTIRPALVAEGGSLLKKGLASVGK